MPEKRLVIFDLDNTLVLNKPAAKAAYESAIRFLAKETKLEFNKLYNHWKKIVQQLQTESAPEMRAFEYSLNILMDRQNISDKYLQPTVQNYEKELINNMKPMPGAKEVVGWLKEQGALVAVAAGTDRSLAKKKLKAVDLYEHIDMVVSAMDVGAMKPHKDYYQLILDELQITATQALVVSDSKDEDLDLAHKMGLATIKLANANPHLSALKEDLSKFLTYTN